MFYKKKFKALQKQVKENEDLLLDLKREVERLRKEIHENKEAPKQPEVTARQIINEWYYTEEELKNNGTVRK